MRRCPEVLAELTARARTNEIFLTRKQRFAEYNLERTPARPPESPWPVEDYVLLNSDSIPMDLTKSVPKAAFLVKRKAAIYMMSASRTKAIFKLSDINITRELMARCPILLENLKKPLEVWQWAERTSGLYVETEGNRTAQLAMVRGLLTTLVWKVKECVRVEAICTGTPEPLLDIQHLQEQGVDIAYDPSWTRGHKSYARDKIDETAAEEFARAATEVGLNNETDPYTLAGRCPGCDGGVPPGTLPTHFLTCQATNPSGYRVECPSCKKQFAEMKYLSQHRALHCRKETEMCDECGNADQCGCKKLRDTLCKELQKLIAKSTKGSANDIFDLANTEGRMLNDKEIIVVCNLVGNQEATWGTKSLQKTLVALGLEKPTPSTKQPDPCPECGKRCKTVEEQENHYETHMQKCNICQYATCDSIELSEHMYQHHYPCTNCEFVGENMSEIQRHTLKCLTVTEETYKTQTNGEETESDSDQETVIDNEEKQEGPSTEQMTNGGGCGTCKAEFQSMDQLLLHWDTNPDHRTREEFNCTRCGKTFNNSIELLQHAQTNHRSEGEDPLWCPCCEKPVKEHKYMKHLRKHSELWVWCPGGIPCNHCHLRSDTVASSLEHLTNFHKAELANTLIELKRHLKADAIKRYGLERATAMAVKKLSGEDSDITCAFEGCGKKFYDRDELATHKIEHQCTMCDYVGRSPRDLTDHKDKHGKVTPGGKRDNNFSCEKCGMKLSTLKELTEHKDNHKKYACAKCQVRFTSNYLANKHELTCTSMSTNDVFEATKTSDPLMVVMNSLGQVVNTFGKMGAMDNEVKDMLKDQLNKAKHNHASRQTAKKNHQVQRTWTFLKPPLFAPSNIVTSYNEKDITSLNGKEFSGRGTAEENYTRLQSLTAAIERIVKSRQITKDVATELLIQHLKSPALDLTRQFREKFEQKHGDGAVPEYEDILLFLEARYINIKPPHAREQLNAMTKGESESVEDFFLRAWRCSHFASFTMEEKDRYKFRQDTVKEAVLRNLGTAKRRLVDDEELERKMKGEEPLEPDEIVELLNRHQNQRESLESTRNRPDYSLVGELSAAQIKRVENQLARGRPRGRIRGLRQINGKGQPPREPQPRGRGTMRGRHPTRASARGNFNGERQIRAMQAITSSEGRQRAKEEKSAWIAEAKQKIGEGCFKCAKQGHGSKQCLKYKILTKQICRKCRTGFHSEQACAVRPQEPNWGPSRGQSQRGRPGRARRPWQGPTVQRQWPQQQRQPKESEQGFNSYRGATRGRRPMRGFPRGTVSRIAQAQYRQNLTWKARQVGTETNFTPIKQERGGLRGTSQPRGGQAHRGKPGGGVYNPFLTAGQQIGRVEARDATEEYMSALAQGS